MGTLVSEVRVTELKRRSEGALLGAALGDAAGWPQETAGRRLGKRPSPSGPLLVAWERRAGNRFLSYLEPVGAGEYSDDTQLVLATARSLRTRDWWSHFTAVELPFWTMYERGGGGATKRSARNWLGGQAPWDGPVDQLRAYLNAGGNGVAMRIVPHVIAGVESNFESIASSVIRNGIATHGHQRALIGAIVHAWVLFTAMRQVETLPYGGLIKSARPGREHWTTLPEGVDPAWLMAIDAATSKSYRELWLSVGREVDALLDRVDVAIGEGSLVNDHKVLEELGALGGDASGAGTVSAVAALYLASRYADEPMLGVRQAAFLPSADTDTIASMTASILGALHQTYWLSAATGQLQDASYISSFADLHHQSRPGDMTVNRVSASDLSRSAHKLQALSKGDSWESPDGRMGIIGSIRELTPKSGVSASQSVVHLDDGQTIFYVKARRTTKTRNALARLSPREDLKLVDSAGIPVEELHDHVHFNANPSVNVKRITATEFARLFPVRASTIAWFLGAGCSAAAGIPTANTMVMDFKLRLFCAATKLPRREIDPGDPLWVARINQFFNGKEGFPPTGDPSEYAVAFERAFPNPRDRRAYIEEAVRKGVPSFGHRVLAALISSHQVPCLFTTNFDSLVERATVLSDDRLLPDEQAQMTVAALDSAERAERCLRDSAWPMLAKLHGDYQSEQLKNVPAELRAQDARMRRVLVESCRRFGLLVVGYSGRDSSVMDALLEAANTNAFPAGLFWTLRPGSSPLPKVMELLQATERAGTEAYLVEVDNFDELAGEVDRQVQLPPVLASHIQTARPTPRVVPVTIPTHEGASFPVLRCSALPILSMPAEARRLSIAEPLTTPQARAALKEAAVHGAVAAVGHQLAAFGRDSDLLSAFAGHGAKLAGSIELDPSADSWALGLLYDALVRALSRGRPLRPHFRSHGHSLVVAEPSPERNADLAERDREALRLLARAYGSPIIGRVPMLNLPFAEGIELRLEFQFGTWWCVFDPHTWVEQPRLETANDSGSLITEIPPSFGTAPDPAGDWRRERWARRYNRTWSEIVDVWARILAPYAETKVRAFWVNEGEGIAGEFTMGMTTAWSRPAHGVAPSGGPPAR